MLRKLIFMAIAQLLAVGVGSALLAGRDGSGAKVADVALVYFDGSAGQLADFRGRPLVLNFWASWCPACVAEMPDFEAVHRQFGGRVAFLGVNVQEIDQVAAQDLVRRTGVTYQLARDPQGEVYRLFGGIAMPTTVFIDAGGRLVDVHAGTLFGDDLAAKIEAELLQG